MSNGYRQIAYALWAGQAGLVNLIDAAGFHPDSPKRHRRAV